MQYVVPVLDALYPVHCCLLQGCMPRFCQNRRHRRQYKTYINNEFYSIVVCMTKVMYVDTVVTVFIFLFLIFGYFFYARRGAYLMVAIFLKTLNRNFGGKQYTFGIKRWKGNGNNYFIHMHTIYHSDHTIPMIPASYRIHGQCTYK